MPFLDHRPPKAPKGLEEKLRYLPSPITLIDRNCSPGCSSYRTLNCGRCSLTSATQTEMTCVTKRTQSLVSLYSIVLNTSLEYTHKTTPQDRHKRCSLSLHRLDGVRVYEALLARKIVKIQSSASSIHTKAHGRNTFGYCLKISSTWSPNSWGYVFVPSTRLPAGG